MGGRIFRVGDRVIQKRNNYDLNVFNGDIKWITRVDNETTQWWLGFKAGQEVKEVGFEKNQLLKLNLAYAITIYKVQGSEFEAFNIL